MQRKIGPWSSGFDGTQISSVRPDRPQFLHNLAHILRVIAVGDQQRVFGVHNDKVFNAHQRHKLLGL
jgi:hypothetical protein